MNTNLSNDFVFDIKEDPNPWFELVVFNSGEGYDEDLNIDFTLKTNNQIKSINYKYIPPALEKRSECTNNKISFSSKFKFLPSHSGVEYKMFLQDFIKTRDEIELSILSQKKNWSEFIKIKPERTSFLIPSVGVAYAENNADKLTSFNSPKSGILIGGYDPLIMSNGVFRLLQIKELINKQDAIDIKKITESYKEGVLFGGINILKFNEMILNRLILRRVIDLDQANSIVEKSKKAGGVMVGDYNIIAMQAELLNILLKNGKITKEEGQKIIDISKSPTNK